MSTAKIIVGARCRQRSVVFSLLGVEEREREGKKKESGCSKALVVNQMQSCEQTFGKASRIFTVSSKRCAVDRLTLLITWWNSLHSYGAKKLTQSFLVTTLRRALRQLRLHTMEINGHLHLSRGLPEHEANDWRRVIVGRAPRRAKVC